MSQRTKWSAKVTSRVLTRVATTDAPPHALVDQPSDQERRDEGPHAEARVHARHQHRVLVVGNDCRQAGVIEACERGTNGQSARVARTVGWCTRAKKRLTRPHPKKRERDRDHSERWSACERQRSRGVEAHGELLGRPKCERSAPGTRKTQEERGKVGSRATSS